MKHSSTHGASFPQRQKATKENDISESQICLFIPNYMGGGLEQNVMECVTPIYASNKAVFEAAV